MKTIIEPKYEPYKKPDNRDNQEAGSINKTIKIIRIIFRLFLKNSTISNYNIFLIMAKSKK